MRFANPEYLWLLMVLPFLGFYLAFFKKGDLPTFRFSSLGRLRQIAIPRGLSRLVAIPGLLRLLTLMFLIVALARPQRGLKSEEMTTKATDIMICLDSSRSMLSEDFKPHNRFAVSKDIIIEFIKGREHDRLGLVVFAEHAITQCPLTTDKAALLGILEQLQIGVIPPDQTAIGVGIASSVNRLKNSVAKSKVIILLTDGANNAGTIDPLTAAKTAAAYGIKIYSIGAGTPEGGLMPIDDPVFGKRMVQIKNDLDEDMLLKIASESNGKYFRAKSPSALKTIFQEIDALEKTDIKVKEYVDYEELYWPILLLALLPLFTELFLIKSLYRTIP